MPPIIANVAARINAIAHMLSGAQKDLLSNALTAAGGDWSTAIASLAGKLSEDVLKKLNLANELAEVANDDAYVVEQFFGETGFLGFFKHIPTLREIATKYGMTEIAKHLPKDMPEGERMQKAADILRRLFAAVPTDVIHKMAEEGTLPGVPKEVQRGIAQLLENLKDVDLLKSNLDDAILKEGSFNGIPEDQRPAVVAQLQNYQDKLAHPEAILNPTDAAAVRPRVPPAPKGPSDKIEARINAIGDMLSADEKTRLKQALTNAHGNWQQAAKALQEKLSQEEFTRISNANALAEWTGDDGDLVKALFSETGGWFFGLGKHIPTLREIALRDNAAKLLSLLPDTIPADEKKQKVKALRDGLFLAVPTDVIHRMAQDSELPIDDKAVQAGIAQFLTNLPTYDFRTSDLEKERLKDAAFRGIPEGKRPAVLDELRHLHDVLPTISSADAISGAKSSKLATTLRSLNAALTDDKDKALVESSLRGVRGDWNAARAKLKDNLSAEKLARLDLARSLGDLLKAPAAVTTMLTNQPQAKSLRDIALNFDKQRFAAALPEEAVRALIAAQMPSTTIGPSTGTSRLADAVVPAPTASDAAMAAARLESATRTWRALYSAVPFAVIQKMVTDGDVPLSDANLRNSVVTFFNEHPEFDENPAGIKSALLNHAPLGAVPDTQKSSIVHSVGTLVRQKNISHIPEALPVLSRLKLSSAMEVADKPQSTFVRLASPELHADDAKIVHAAAVNMKIRNENTLMIMRDAVHGAGLAAIDGNQTREQRIAELQDVANAPTQPVQIDLSTLFADIDYCPCSECNSIYGPSAYFIDLLQYVRNNNFDRADSALPDPPPNPLDVLLTRRPDLADLQLTCENANTVLPYMDIANEVMEHYVAHGTDYDPDRDVFNVAKDEPSSQLVAESEHINYDAYCKLNQTVYPFTLPYNLPVDVIRVYLKNFGTSFYELLDTYRSPECVNPKLTADEQKALNALHDVIVSRAVDAEYLGLTKEEYIILTKEAFLRYEELPDNKKVTLQAYQQVIGMKNIYDYFGYPNEQQMLNGKETEQQGLTFVKKQFLPRTGILYADLVDLLKTRFINPHMPQGIDLEVMESLQFSYRYLQSLVNQNDPQNLDKLIQTLESPEKIPQVAALLAEGGFQLKPLDKSTLRRWVHCYFRTVGKVIVLGNSPVLLYSQAVIPELKGTLYDDGKIRDDNGQVIGWVGHDGSVVKKAQGDLFTQSPLDIQDCDKNLIARINDHSLLINLQNPPVRINWLPAQDTCDLTRTRLMHLDGSPVTACEYDKMQRFVRLWRKLGWSIADLDSALLSNGQAQSEGCDDTTLAAFATDDCAGDSTGGGCGKEGVGPSDSADIDGDFITKLAAIKKLVDLTGLPLQQLLAFWAPIGTAGDKSLYASLFLIHNMLGIDKVFAADDDGNYLTNSEKIANHIPILMAAFNLKADDVRWLAAQYDVEDLTLSTVSQLYRYSLLAKTLQIKVTNLPDLEKEKLFGSVFSTPQDTLTFFLNWGKLQDAGFSFAQLDYMILGTDDPLRPLGPSLMTILQITKALYDGLTQIQSDHKDLPSDPATAQQAATDERVRSEAGLVFNQPTTSATSSQTNPANASGAVDKIMQLLDGTGTYSISAPAKLGIDLSILAKQPGLSQADKAMIQSLSSRLQYTDTSTACSDIATLAVTGILSPAQTAFAKGLSANPGWASALDKAALGPQRIFNDLLKAIFKTDDDKTALLAPDVPDSTSTGASNPIGSGTATSKNNDAATSGSNSANQPPPTGPAKRFHFLKVFLPFLRDVLSRRLIVNTLAGAVNLSNDVTDLLLSSVFAAGAESDTKDASSTDSTPLAIFGNIQHDAVPENASSWTGFLVPPTDGAYQFFAATKDAPTAPLLGGQLIQFNSTRDDVANGWWSNTTLSLKGGVVCPFTVTDLALGGKTPQLQWKTQTTSPGPIPPSSLFPYQDGQSDAQKLITSLFKAAILINSFNLNVDEIGFFFEHPHDFNNLDFQNVTMPQCLQLQAYTALRTGLPKLGKTLLDVFKWGNNASYLVDPTHADSVSLQINAVTLWNPNDKTDNIAKLLTRFQWNEHSFFKNEARLVKLQQAVTVAGKIAESIDLLFAWAKPGGKFPDYHKIADSIRHAFRARYNQTDWEQAVAPLSNQLRDNQKNALIAYLLVQPDLRVWGVIDADSLFEYFLIDVQMEPPVQTTRMVQASSSVQLFVQRCFLGLEDRLDANGKQIGVTADILDRGRWTWMQRYRVWQAYRQVFLYPENWIQPSLRDDKTTFYQELESQLLQKDVNPETIQDAIKTYLFKVDEVANLKVVGLFLEQDTDNDGMLVKDKTTAKPSYIKLHVFGQKRNAPFLYYYRYYDIRPSAKTWSPWELVDVDITSYSTQADSSSPKISGTGAYVIPVVWNKRLFVFFPQIVRKSSPSTSSSTLNNRSFKAIAGSDDLTPGSATPVDYWEIKLGWSENRNQKWTPKQVSNDTFNFDIWLIPVDNFDFVPRFQLDATKSRQVSFTIDVFGGLWGLSVGWAVKIFGSFRFTGSQLVLQKTPSLPSATLPAPTSFHYQGDSKIHTFQCGPGDVSPPFITDQPSFTDPFFTNTDPNYADPNATDVMGASPDISSQPFRFNHPFVNQLLEKLNLDSLDKMYQWWTNKFPFGPSTPGDVFDKNDAYGYNGPAPDGTPLYHELKRPYSLYNWEAGFHAPMMLVDRLLTAQQFDKALAMCQYVFDPNAKGTEVNRAWQFPPFKDVNPKKVLQTIFASLSPGAPASIYSGIAAWRDNPASPHALARIRPTAYMKWVVMQYIKLMIAWGDYYFRMNTMEYIPMAIQCYVIASHLYGPRGQMIPRRGRITPQTYNSLRDQWDAFGNAMVQLELAFPSSNQNPFPTDSSDDVPGFANVFGFATSRYFCIPNNPNLTTLRDTIDNRLYNIHNSLDINGVFRQLPPFEPPIDPGLLVQAAAQGLSLASVLNDLTSPVPNYRFYFLLQKALELCAEVKALGNAFLSNKEKGDGEALSRLRAGHETSIQNLIMQVKKQQLKEATSALDALQQSRKSPELRMRYYLQLIGQATSIVPDTNTDFSELPNDIEKPVDDSGLKLIQYEKEEMDKAGASAEIQATIGAIETLANVMHLLPNLGLDAMFWGIGIDAKFGGQNLGDAMSAVARGLRTSADYLSFQSSNASRRGGFTRALQERVQQASTAGYELKSIDKQILTQQIRIDIANQEITNQQKQIDNANAIEDFLRNKYTNQELYAYIDSSIRALYYQAYTLAYDLAKKAEKVYNFERVQPTNPGSSSSTFVGAGYWDPAHDGLLSGEKLYIALKQLEAAYQAERGYDYEIVKQISLRQLDPLALMDLRAQGNCSFSLPEVLFDLDFPGHYMRRIKSVSLTIPCVVGPYTSLNCILSMENHKYRTTSIVGTNGYSSPTDGTADDQFTTCIVPIKAIAVCTGQNDSGLFELNFKDERYLPFEGAGAVSSWKLEIPTAVRQFDYQSITDVVMNLRYTAIEGGEKLKGAAAKSATTFLGKVSDFARSDGLFAAFDLRHDFPTEWTRAFLPSGGIAQRVIALTNLADRLPLVTRWAKIDVAKVYLVTPKNIDGGITFSLNDQTFAGQPGAPLEVSNPPPMDHWQIGILGSVTTVAFIWLVIQFGLK